MKNIQLGSLNFNKPQTGLPTSELLSNQFMGKQITFSCTFDLKSQQSMLESGATFRTLNITDTRKQKRMPIAKHLKTWHLLLVFCLYCWLCISIVNLYCFFSVSVSSRVLLCILVGMIQTYPRLCAQFGTLKLCIDC